MVHVARGLPFFSRFVTYDELMAEERELERIKRENLNPFDWDMIVKYNMADCHNTLSPYDIAHRGLGY